MRARMVPHLDDRIQGDEEEKSGQAEQDEAREMVEPKIEVYALSHPRQAEFQVFDGEEFKSQVEDGDGCDERDGFSEIFETLGNEQADDGDQGRQENRP